MGGKTKTKLLKSRINVKDYSELQIKAKELNLTLEDYSGLILMGFEIKKREI
jgi:hypothetical protein